MNSTVERKITHPLGTGWLGDRESVTPKGADSKSPTEEALLHCPWPC